ncbi:hypothetical protein KAFR_0E01090 [Kazachstania africana CBS 2517]|uniref:Rad61 Wapl domain-containing protein n=1 Tax=Kazachstania africana (strain ATCC 22294 / BCRC 22015 / CBS 2517 / CECT 1963 / NBRC 1671 / NRRL Y-8276) TaxID=1071382 RepID=H2AV63_KAZAF|nr:hypothetical protein KAFR_0E01090 [Kazachstania africana CBS 2517]CCF58263.1 hypothetical protein KAFR_0E01090 [Kazachstania africana CBS 2517]
MKTYSRRGRSAPVISYSKLRTPDFSLSDNDDQDLSDDSFDGGDGNDVIDESNDSAKTEVEIIISSKAAFIEEAAELELTTDKNDPPDNELETVDNLHTTEEIQDQDDHLIAFDFMDSTKKVKRRRTNYKRTTMDVDSEDNSPISKKTSTMKKVVEDVDDFLSNLKPFNEEYLQKMIENELLKETNDQDCTEADNTISSQRVYNNKRTILHKTNEFEKDVADDDESGQLDEHEDGHSDRTIKNDVTYHYNELKNMGSSIKYQEDLEFLTFNGSTDMKISSFASKLLNFIYAIDNDQSFLEYIQKNHESKLLDWCFTKNVLDIPELLVLQGALMYKLNIKLADNNIHKIANLGAFLIALSKIEGIPNSSKIFKSNKLLNLSYQDYLEKRNIGEDGLFYSIKLWERYNTAFKGSHPTIKRLLEIIKKGDINIAFLIVLETVLSLVNFRNERVSINLSKTVGPLVTNFNGFKENDKYVKNLILLTNEDTILVKIPQGEKNSIFLNSFNFVLSNINEAENLDILLLHLGLCLNVINECDGSIRNLDQLCSTAGEIIMSNHVRITNKLMRGLICLNLTFLIKLEPSNKIDDEMKTQLTHELNIFEEQTGIFNKSINEKVKLALKKILYN